MHIPSNSQSPIVHGIAELGAGVDHMHFYILNLWILLTHVTAFHLAYDFAA